MKSVLIKLFCTNSLRMFPRCLVEDKFITEIKQIIRHSNRNRSFKKYAFYLNNRTIANELRLKVHMFHDHNLQSFQSIYLSNSINI